MTKLERRRQPKVRITKALYTVKSLFHTLKDRLNELILCVNDHG